MKKQVLFTAFLVTALCTSLMGCSGTAPAPKSAESAAKSSDAAPADSGKTYTIKFAMAQGGVAAEESGEVMFIEKFKDEVESKSQGRLKVEIYPNGQLGSSDENVQGIIANNLEMASVNISLLNSLYKESMLVSCPGIFASEQECDDVLAGEWGVSFFKDMEEKTGVKMLAPVCNGFRCFTTSNKELTTVDTAKGVTFRVMQSPVSIKMVEALGAKAVPMAGSEMYTAMQNGTVDGQENPVVNILNDKTYEVQKYLVLDKHMASINAFVMSSKFYNGLPDDLKGIIDEATANAAVESANVFNNINTQGIDKLKEAGMTVYEPTEEEAAAWHNAMSAPCQDYIRGEIGDEVVDGLLKAVETYRNK